MEACRKWVFHSQDTTTISFARRNLSASCDFLQPRRKTARRGNGEKNESMDRFEVRPLAGLRVVTLEKNINCLSFSPRSDLLAAAGDFGRIRVWEITDGKAHPPYRESRDDLEEAYRLWPLARMAERWLPGAKNALSGNGNYPTWKGRPECPSQTAGDKLQLWITEWLANALFLQITRGRCRVLGRNQ